MLSNQYHMVVFSLLLTLNSYGDTVKNKTQCNKPDWQCHKTFYLAGGTYLVHAFYTKHSSTFTPTGLSPISYSTSNNFPKNIGGIRFSLGAGFTETSPFGYEIGYQQSIPTTLTSPGLQVTYENKVLAADVSFALNPEGRLKTKLIAGAAVISGYTTITTRAPHQYFSQTTNAVDIDPFIGVIELYSINSRFGIKLEEIYDIAAYNRNVNGSFVLLLMLNYYPK